MVRTTRFKYKFGAILLNQKVYILIKQVVIGRTNNLGRD